MAIESDGHSRGNPTKMGPVKLQFAGTAKIVVRDEAGKRIVKEVAIGATRYVKRVGHLLGALGV